MAEQNRPLSDGEIDMIVARLDDSYAGPVRHWTAVKAIRLSYTNQLGFPEDGKGILVLLQFEDHPGESSQLLATPPAILHLAGSGTEVGWGDVSFLITSTPEVSWDQLNKKMEESKALFEWRVNQLAAALNL